MPGIISLTAIGMFAVFLHDHFLSYNPEQLVDDLAQYDITSEVRDDDVYIFYPTSTFEFDSCEIKHDVSTMLENTTLVLNQYRVRHTSVLTEGHTSKEGSAEYNQKLSQCRARIIGDRLMSLGLDADRITSVGHGESYADEPGYGRVVFVIVYEEN